MKRLAALIALAFTLGACTDYTDLQEIPQPMGRFLLGHNIVVANDAQKGPMSREASEEDWIAAMTTAIDERFSRYDGDQYFHIATRVEGYVLAVPGIPLVAAPKSILIVSVTLWDDAKGEKINEEPERFTVVEDTSGQTFVSSGLTQSREQQMDNLSRKAAKMIHDWMLEHPEWFGDASLMDPATTSAGRPALAPDETVGETPPAE